MICKISLNSRSNLAISTIWSQGWLSDTDLNLIGERDSDWNNYIATVWKAHIRLGPLEDEIIWGRNMIGGIVLVMMSIYNLYTPVLRFGWVVFFSPLNSLRPRSISHKYRQ